MIIEISHFLSILATGLFLLVGYFSLLTPSSNSRYISILIDRTYSHGFFFLLSSFLIYVWSVVILVFISLLGFFIGYTVKIKKIKDKLNEPN